MAIFLIFVHPEPSREERDACLANTVGHLPNSINFPKASDKSNFFVSPPD